MTVQTPPARLLIVDDDTRLTSMVGDYLRQAGFEIDEAHTLQAARARLQQRLFDGVILDLMLPDGDGLNFTAELRQQARLNRLPLMMLTARGDPTDRVVGLEMGADDYLAKPFEPRELLARIKALLRRTQPQANANAVLRVGDLEVDIDARQARVGGSPCDLTSYQFDLLRVLAQNAGRVLSRDQIMDGLKGQPLEAFDRSIDVHVSRIRAAIEIDPRQPQRLLTVRGVGYLLAKPPAA